MNNEKKRIITAITLALSPLFLWFFAYLAYPGFILPFLNHPIARLVLLAALVWLLIGMAFMLRARKIWQFVLLALLFPVPVNLIPMLGPAVVTIIQVEGPVIQSVK